ncbi:hypothetical protein KEM55_001898 [Ascosphaera atra]|nr:hypothetical protein KEM55_001898 [Ascosphaera atra]
MGDSERRERREEEEIQEACRFDLSRHHHYHHHRNLQLHDHKERGHHAADQSTQDPSVPSPASLLCDFISGPANLLDTKYYDEHAAPSSSSSTSSTPPAYPPATNTTKESAPKYDDNDDPPPPYEEGSSPLTSFTYVMAAAGGAASILTQAQQSSGPGIGPLDGKYYTASTGTRRESKGRESGTQFTLTRDELLTLPEFVLLSLFPNGLLPEGNYGPLSESEVHPVDYDPASLQYILDFFRSVASTITSRPPSPTWQSPGDSGPGSPAGSNAQDTSRDMLQGRAGIIVLREDLDFYVIPPRPDIDHPEMLEVKRRAARIMLQQNEIFSGLKDSSKDGSTEQHLIEMLTAGGFERDACWGHRSPEPNKAVIGSLALARLRTEPMWFLRIQGHGSL